MAQLTNASFSINGNAISVFTSFSLSQSIFDHHQFSLVCPAEAIDGKAGIFTSSKDMIGGTFGARILAEGFNGSLLFKGVVTSVETSRFTGHHGNVIISGYSPTIMMESGPHCQSWEKKAIKNIANDVLKPFPQNLLSPKVQPLYGETLAYTVQYKETAWEFLQRLTGTFGEWLFWDGQALIIGQPQSGESVTLTYGSHISSFNMSLNARPVKTQMMGWDYLNSQVYTSQPSGVEDKAGLNPLGKQVMQLGQSIYTAQPVLWNNQFLTNKKQQDDITNMKSAIQGSRMIMFNGKSGHPGVKIGGMVEVSGNNVFSEQTEGYGEYLVIAATHYVDAMGNYDNQFTAVPGTIRVPPVVSPKEPNCETQSAIVTDNNDFNGLGRIRVKFHWMGGSEKTPWIRVTTPHAGGGKGMFFIPEVGEEVIIGFEGDSATKPYVIGAVYHGKANNSFGNAGNDVKALQSRSGNKVLLDDNAGSVFVEDKDGNSVLMDGAGNVTMKSNESITLTCGDSTLNMKKDGTITISGKDVFTVATKDVVSSAKNNLAMVADVDFLASGKTTATVSSKATTVVGSNEMGLFSKKLEAVGSATTSINGGKIDMGAGGDVSVTGAIVKINS
ncbi:phage baseplate assembly protein V [Niabella yanshanensis]|uniref:Phage baseplate assembly protein V n=1 Tax=Niabella yanshanensis TaxID=577386 RepID=A0ABZ0WA44_9BACT|nr:phage baseplate assembly protein V [Niabella yanshanensis]WQD40056.1 phage baseplate assembly protein V [Niabella yanshanensis]